MNLNPQFVDPETGDFHLETSSPCIDAGDPYAPLDPDGTNADMGKLNLIADMVIIIMMAALIYWTSLH